MAVVMYDLVGRDDRRFSPYCWRARMALAHKGLEVETRPTPFTAIPAICDGAQKSVPVIEDDGRLVSDSGTIARYLDETYADAPALLGDAGQQGLTAFVENWVGMVLQAGIFPAVVADVHAHLLPEDQDYFRSSREQRLGRTLEEIAAGREARLEAFRQSLMPLRLTVSNQAFLGGDSPIYADYVAFGAFQWARSISDFRLLEDDDPIRTWIARCLDLHGGVARAAVAYD